MNQPQQPQPFLELVVEGARIVSGHPMDQQQRKKDNQLVFKDDGSPSMETFFAVAVPKGQEAGYGADGWKHSAWGQHIMARAHQDWPNGEWQIPAFAWKIEDGDSMIPNQNGKKNCDREGYPGHWVIKGTTGMGVKCYDGTSQGAMPEILDRAGIKCGDYVSVGYQVRGNAPAPSKGMYMNPSAVMLVRHGTAIVSAGAGSDAATLFGRETTSIAGNAAPLAPAGAVPGMVSQGIPPQSVPPVMAPGAVPPSVPAVPATPPPAMAGVGIAPNVANTALAPAPTGYAAPPTATSALPAGAPAGVQPHNDFLNVGGAPTPPPAAAAPPVEESFNVNGQVFTKAQLVAQGWQEEQIATLPRA